MMKGKKTVMAILGVVLASGGLVACKHHGSHGDHAGRIKEHVNASLKKVDATDAQKAKIDGIVDQISADGKQLHGSSEGLKAKVIDGILQDTPDRAGLHGLVDEKAKDMTGFAHRTLDRFIEISAVLTPEQRLELKKKFVSAHGAEK